MSKAPLVTVGITSYNNACYLRQCLNSVLNQTYPYLEVIVVDDASNDESLEILNECSDRIRLIRHEKNSGSLVQGRIDVINSAKGEYVAHLDADDFWQPTFVERLISEFHDSPQLDWVAGNTKVVNAGGFIVNQWNYDAYATDFDQCIKRGFTTASLPFPNNGVFKMAFLKNNCLTWYRLPNTLQGEDVITATKYLECRPNLKLVPDFLFNYRIHSSNMSAQPAERIKMIIDIKEYYFNRFDAQFLFNDQTINTLENTSDEFNFRSHYLLAKDLMQIRQDIKIPAAFSTDNTEAELLDNLWRFDEPIKLHCEQALSFSNTHISEIKGILNGLECAKSICEGRKKLILGDFKGSEDLFAKALNSDSKSLEALCGLGESFYLQGNLDKAEEFTAKAIEVAPANSRILNNAGVLFSAFNDGEKSVRAFLKSIASDPHNLDAHLNFASVMPAFSRDKLVSNDLKQKLIETLNWMSNNYPDNSREKLLIENWQLASQVVNKFRNIYKHLGKRVLLHVPDNGALKYLMQSWQDILIHMGIKTETLAWHEDARSKFDTFDPDVFMTVNDDSYLARIDLECVHEWRQRNWLKLGLILSYDEPAENADFLITFHRQPENHPVLSTSELPLVSLPFAANPLQHFMRPGRAIWDFFFVGTNSAFKQSETKAYLEPILQNYNGILAGVNWNRGLTEIPIKIAPLFYNFAKICPNYHVSRQIEEYNEVNERTFIIPACGGFQIVDNPKAITDCFTKDELVVAQNLQEYKEMFQYFLGHDEERTKYIQNSMRRVFKDHTLFHVLTRFANYLDSSRTDKFDSQQIKELQPCS